MLLGTVIAALLTVAVIVARFEIAELFLDKSVGDAEATIGLTAELLMVAASRFVTDAAQSIAAGGLRGLKDTRVPLLFVCIAYWLIGFSLGYVLGLKSGLVRLAFGLACQSGRPSMRGSSSCVSNCWRAGVLSEPSLDCVMTVLGERESRNARRLQGSLRLQRGKASDWKQDDRPRSHQQLRAFCKGTSKPICRAQFDIHLVVADRATEVRAGTFSSALSFLPRPGRALLQAHHPSRPSGTADLKKMRRPIGAYNAIARTACELLTRTPPPEPRATLSANFRNGAASPGRKLRNAGGELWLNTTSGECAYVH